MAFTEWVQLAISWDGQTLRPYQNGELDDEINFTQGQSINFNGGDWSIGALSSNGGEEFGGELDDIRIYNRTFSDQQIQDLYTFETLSEDLVMDIDFNENIIDQSIVSSTLTPGDVSEFVMGRNGTNNSALYSDGINDNLSISPSTDYRVQYPLTMAGWVYLPDSSINSRIFASNDNSTRYYGVVLQTVAGKVAVSTGNDQGAGSQHRKSSNRSTILRSNQWYHVVAVMNSNGNTDLYVNGVPETVTYSGTATTLVYTTTNNGKFGSWDRTNAANEIFTNIAVDDFKMWSRSLSQTEVSMLYLPAVNNDLGTITSLFDHIGINENNSLNIFPNPSTGLSQVQSDKNITNIQVYRTDGSLMNSTYSGSSLDLSEYDNGCYFIEAIYEDGTSEKTKIVINK